MTIFGNIDDTSTESEIKSIFQEVQSSFSEEQKQGVLASLMRVSDADQEFHLLEEQLLRLIAKMLDYELKENRNEVRTELFEIDAGDVLTALGSLNEDQKDWYIFTIAAMIQADKKILKVEIDYAGIFLEHMQISEKRFDKVVGQSETLAQYFI